MLGYFYVLSMFYSKCQIADIININIVTNKTMCKILHHSFLSSEFTGTFLIHYMQLLNRQQYSLNIYQSQRKM